MLNGPAPVGFRPVKSGLLNTIGVETFAGSAPVVPGQFPFWYDGPSKSLSPAPFKHQVNPGLTWSIRANRTPGG